MRTIISSEQRDILEDFFSKGMKSKGKKCDLMHEEAAHKASLKKDVVVEWVGNRLKKESGRKYAYQRKTSYTKGISAYNLFVQENKDHMKDINDWAKKWMELREEEKEVYRLKVKTLTPNTNPVKSKLVLMNKLQDTLMELENLGVSLCCFGTDAEGNQWSLGKAASRDFIQSRNDIFTDFRSHTFKGNPESSAHSQQLSELRKKTSLHLNKLYATATGTVGPLPYKKVFQGKVLIGGLPDEVLPLRFPSSYGIDKLSKILACQEIQVILASEFEEETVSDETKMAEHPILTPEEVEVLAPLIV